MTIIVDHPKLRIDTGRLHAHIHLICEKENCALLDLSIVFTRREIVRRLNVKYLQHDDDTDVIAFPLGDSTSQHSIDGEIYVNLDMALTRCTEFSATFEEEAYRYAIHGLLHLMHYDDKTPEQRALMKQKESDYLEMLTQS